VQAELRTAFGARAVGIDGDSPPAERDEGLSQPAARAPDP
jgi:hypothetical protein